MAKPANSGRSLGGVLATKQSGSPKARPGYTTTKTIRTDAMEPADAARMTACPAIGAVRVIASAEQHTAFGKATGGNWSDLSRDLALALNRIGANDLRDLEGMLYGQAVALQSLFVRLTEGALAAETVPNYDLKFRYALRAQAQCRATLETLAAIKNPPVVFARQANVVNGPQQINNGIARAEKAEDRQNELSGEAIELRPNGGPSTLAPESHSAVASVGAFDGATDSPGEKQIVTQCVEGRRPRGPSRAAEAPSGTSAKCGGNRSGAREPAASISVGHEK